MRMDPGFSISLRGKLYRPVIATVLFVALNVFAPKSALIAAPQQPAIDSGNTDPSLVDVIEIQTDQSRKLSLRDTRQDILAFTRRLRSAETPRQRMAAVVDMCGLYLSIIADPRFASAQPLQGYRGRIAARLQQESKQLKRQIKDELENARSSSAGHHSTDSTRSQAKEANQFVTDIVDPHWELVAHFAGATGPVSYHASGLHGSSGHFLRDMNAGRLFDHGPELVALIEAMLHPDYWQAAGGEGVVHYYRPIMVLVVRARTTVHEDLEEFLERLR